MAVLAPESAKAAVLDGEEVVHAGIANIAKWEDGPEGSVYVYGRATTPEVDTDEQIVSPDFSGPALKAMLDETPDGGGPLRVQHNPTRDPAGSVIKVEIDRDGDGAHWIRGKVDEPDAIRLVKNRHLRAFSIGIARPVVERDPTGKARGGVIKGGRIVEVSLVDSPANRSCWLEMAKADKSGRAEVTGKVFGADALLTKDGRSPRAYRTVSVDLPSKMKLKFSPAQLARMQTMAQRTAVAQAEVVKAAAEDVIAKSGPLLDRLAVNDTAAAEAYKAAEAAVYKRDINTATRDRLASQGRALSDGSYPIETHEDADNAVTLALSGHGNVSGAKALIRRIARKEGWQDILDRLKGKKKDKAPKAATPDKCMCEGTGMCDGQPCPHCDKGEKLARAQAAKKKKRVMCASCGAKQNIKHQHCPECGNPLHPGAIPVMNTVRKNHDFACLHCGKDLDKGEKFCPGCGKENPGYLEVADRKLPMNEDKTAKERVATKAKKGKKGKKGKPFGGNQAKPFGAEDEAKDDQDAKKTAAVKGKKKGGKGRSPATGAVPQSTEGLPRHREPDGAPVEQFENDSGLEDGDQQMKTAMRFRSLGIDPGLGMLHDLCCPAFKAADVDNAIPGASFAAIDTELWQRKALDAASGADIHLAMERYNEMAALSRHAVTLKTADPAVLDDIRAAGHGAFLAANKTFADATPGPGSFPTPSHPMPGQFSRPYISAGHGAASPQHDGPRTFAVPEGQIAASSYDRGYLSAGHASDSPANDGTRTEPQPQPMTGGQPENVHYQGTMRANAEQAVNAMHDHVSRLFPGVCPMSPPVGEGQKPAHPVPEAVGGPVPHAAGKAARPARTKAQRKADAARKAARVAKRKAAQARKAAKAQARKAAQVAVPAAPEAAPAAAPALDEAVITKAVTAATRPLARRMKAQDKEIRKLRKTANAIASQPDTTAAPFRGAGAAKTASASPAGMLTAAGAAEQAQSAQIRRLHAEWRGNPNPEMREAAWHELTTRYGINPVTGPSTPYPMQT